MEKSIKVLVAVDEEGAIRPQAFITKVDEKFHADKATADAWLNTKNGKGCQVVTATLTID